jgi:hypothetical protein
VLRDSDELLYVISAKKEMSWSSFKQIFDYLYILNINTYSENEEKISDTRLSIVNFLNSLAHCEFHFDENNRRVYATPPALIRLPCAGFPQAILVGSRTLKTIEKLKSACKIIGENINIDVKEQGSELVLVPKRIVVQTEDISELPEIASRLAINFIETPPAWSLLNFSASLQDYLDTCQWSNESELNWKRHTFDPSSLKFFSSTEIILDINMSNVRLSQYEHPYSNTTIHYLWRNEKNTKVDRDWGRYAVLEAKKINVIIYDKHKFMMAVPVNARLPRLLERALTLCSGYVAKLERLPYHNFNPISSTSTMAGLSTIASRVKVNFNIFRDIPPQIAEITAAKLGQTLIRKSLNIKL